MKGIVKGLPPRAEPPRAKVVIGGLLHKEHCRHSFTALSAGSTGGWDFWGEGGQHSVRTTDLAFGVPE